MMSWFIPREAKFFDMFRITTDLIIEGSKEMVVLIDNVGRVETHAQKIKEIETRGDKNTHAMVQELHATFLTPLDREDMYELVSKLDDILDYLYAVSQRFHLYEIRAATPEIRELAEIIVRSTEKVRFAVNGLENMKTSSQTLTYCKEINALESQADHVLRMGMSRLFREQNDMKEFIKLKEVIELLEAVTDRCKEVSHIVEGIVLDHA
jgi:predicted phosphate transport protein (TIGR00153 family)